MLRKGVRKIQTLKFQIYVAQVDIEEGKCLEANHCMVKVAVERKLRVIEPAAGNHHTRVDAGHIRFNYGGYRYLADTPRIAKAKLIAFDREAKARRQALRAGGSFKSKIEPFSFTVIAERKSKIKEIPRERQDQVNEARRRRVASGQKQSRYTLHQRVVGFA